MHIIYLETKAILFAFMAFGNRLQNESIKVNSDNKTAISYINKYGGCHCPQLNDLSQKIWTWCINRNIHITATHVPGVQNISADKLSRIFVDNTELSLNSHVFDSHTIDLFA